LKQGAKWEKWKKKLLYALTPGEHLRRIFRITKFKAPEMAADLPRNIYIVRVRERERERERDIGGEARSVRERERERKNKITKTLRKSAKG